MTRTAPCWWHLILNARGSWLTGDPRGFRSRNHRKHSTGDYINPPPAGEHAGLHRAVRRSARPAMSFPRDLWPVLGGALRIKIASQKHRVLVISVDAHHAHLIVELPGDRNAVKRAMGAWKQHASHAVRDRLPGRIWSSSGDPIRIKSRAHQVEAFKYIADHATKGAWVWRFDREG